MDGEEGVDPGLDAELHPAPEPPDASVEPPPPPVMVWPADSLMMPVPAVPPPVP